MLGYSDTALSVLSSAGFSYYVRAESWLSDDLLMSDIPIISGRESVDNSSNIPERITVTIPRMYNDVDLSPYTDDSPLAANGQQLRIEVGVGLDHGIIEWQQRGWFLIYESTVQGDTIEVDAWGLLQLIAEARFVTPFQPTGSLTTTVRGIVEPGLTAVFDSSLTDRSVPAAVNYTDDRLDTLNSVLDAWPAVGRVNADGDLYVTTATPSSTPVKTISESDDNTTVIQVVGGSSRAGVYNAVVAQGIDASGNTIQGNVAYDTTTAHGINTDFNPLPVPLFFDSTLLTTVQAATNAARTRMNNIIRQTNKAYDVSIVPDPSLVAGDTVTLESRFGTIVGTIETLDLPYVPSSGETMRLTIREL